MLEKIDFINNSKRKNIPRYFLGVVHYWTRGGATPGWGGLTLGCRNWVLP
jgi:hypothetical protein